MSEQQQPEHAIPTIKFYGNLLLIYRTTTWAGLCGKDCGGAEEARWQLPYNKRAEGGGEAENYEIKNHAWFQLQLLNYNYFL